MAIGHVQAPELGVKGGSCLQLVKAKVSGHRAPGLVRVTRIEDCIAKLMRPFDYRRNRGVDTQLLKRSLETLFASRFLVPISHSKSVSELRLSAG